MKGQKFLKLACPRCSHTQLAYTRSSYESKCSVCNYLLIKSTGGKAKIRARVKDILWNYEKMKLLCAQ